MEALYEVESASTAGYRRLCDAHFDQRVPHLVCPLLFALPSALLYRSGEE